MTQGSGHTGPSGRSALTVDVASHDGVAVVAVAGEIDAASVDVLRSRVEELGAAGQVDQVLDLDGVSFLDSSGLGALVTLRRRLDAEGGRLVLACANEVVLRLLRLTNLDAVLTVHPSVDEALGAGFAR